MWLAINNDGTEVFYSKNCPKEELIRQYGDWWHVKKYTDSEGYHEDFEPFETLPSGTIRNLVGKDIPNDEPYLYGAFNTTPDYEIPSTVFDEENANVEEEEEEKEIEHPKVENIGEAGDILFYDKEEKKRVIDKPENIKDYCNSRYVPIGVVAVPLSHNAYGTGEGAVVSLMCMCTKHPDEGSAMQDMMYWGGSNEDTPLISYCTTVNINNLSSPYNKDGSKNEEYYALDESITEDNALSDMYGMRNTEIIVNEAIAEDWQHSVSVTDCSEKRYYPAACCCKRFRTEGTKQGDWYLPACGELAYVYHKYDVINASIQAIKDEFGSYFACKIPDFWLCSSTEHSTNAVECICMYNGLVDGQYKTDYHYHTRAFLRISGSDIGNTAKEEEVNKVIRDEELCNYYDEAANAIVDRFKEKHGLDNEGEGWIADEVGGTYFFGDTLILDFGDIVTDLRENAKPYEIYEWKRYNDNIYEINETSIKSKLPNVNYKHWLMGWKENDTTELDNLREKLRKLREEFFPNC